MLNHLGRSHKIILTVQHLRIWMIENVVQRHAVSRLF
ncbi:Uncharacterised protein [Vibrio cholerae]|nr:Uncharacterised protein [Vibrio cholerae]